MTSKYDIITLGELTVDNRGSYGIAASAVEYSDDLFTYLRISDITDDGRINKNDLKSVSEQNAKDYLLKPNDIVFARTGGSTGRNYFYDGKDGQFVYAGFLIKFSIDPQKVNPKYIKYYCQSKNYRDWVHSFNTGSTRGNINAQTYSKMPIILPPRTQQDILVKVLSSLDDKIELNNKINQNLEQQAQAIFKSWFVDFEPFGGKMPDDWRIGKVEEIINIYDSKRIPLSNKERSEMTKKVYPYYGATSLMDYVDNYIFDGIYLLLGEDGTVIDNLGFPILQYVWGKFWVNNHAHILTGKNGYSVESLYLFFKQKNIKSIVTGAVQAKISQNNLKNLDTLIPSKSTMNEFNKMITPLFDAIRNNTNENKQLTQLRDTLLPKLMSGEINVDKI